MNNVTCESADAVYDLKGDSRLPVSNVSIKNIQVGKINKFYNNVYNVLNFNEENITFRSYNPETK